MNKQLFTEFEGTKIPLVSTGVSPFAGSPQFGDKAAIYLEKFFNDAHAMLEIMEACYEGGGRGIGAIAFGKVVEAVKIMKETHDDYVVTGSTLPANLPDPGIEQLIDLDAKIIYVHGSISDAKSDRVNKLLDEISSRGIIPGLAVHNPISTLEFAFENNLNAKTFLVPFNANGMMMVNQQKLEKLVDSRKETVFMGMKTLAAGTIEPKKAYEYISNHNIRAVAIGMVDVEEARTVTEIALKALQK
ncbi:MAG: hypothetical protein KGD65_06380 [Candidatus Lokiarchaeota archaeon]|nr:hypothetical protein [Candidatus Lokiarchaeota archaeon]